ncbi:hypothetical protein BDY21DRAFT_369477 [Lineolata rhizophorae]|uniref:Uncharacterized protein n=1 Tax=Lineolata rhizophorae TaxID=578093 RepID=A0A6A6P942_9PEZI|nr:hypothetical protein BDY21DRAFT_369477 [Lineolata rhizophorae]
MATPISPQPIRPPSSSCTSTPTTATELRHPTPDLQSLQGAYAQRVERLEERAERLSMGSNMADEIRKLQLALAQADEDEGREREVRLLSREGSLRESARALSRVASAGGGGTGTGPLGNNGTGTGTAAGTGPAAGMATASSRSRNPSTSSYTNSIVEVNSAARAGGYSPAAAFITSPLSPAGRSGSASWSHVSRPSLGQRTTSRSSRLGLVAGIDDNRYGKENEEDQNDDDDRDRQVDSPTLQALEHHQRPPVEVPQLQQPRPPPRDGSSSNSRPISFLDDYDKIAQDIRAELDVMGTPKSRTPEQEDHAPLAFHDLLEDPFRQEQQQQQSQQQQQQDVHDYAYSQQNYNDQNYNQNPAHRHSTYNRDHDHPISPSSHRESFPDRPPTAASTNTFQQAQTLFRDFDGTHYEPTIHEAASPTTPPSRHSSAPDDPDTSSFFLCDVPRPDSQGVPPPADGMVYYPAPVPRTLNLPKRLSAMPASTARDLQSRRRTQLLESLSADVRKAVPWIGGGGSGGRDNASESARRSSGDAAMTTAAAGSAAGSMTGVTAAAGGKPRGGGGGSGAEAQAHHHAHLPPQLRASLFFDAQSVPHDVEVKRDSAVATLESILEASARAPVNAFTDHPFAGGAGSDAVYGKENKAARRSVTTLLDGGKKRETSGGSAGGVAAANAAKRRSSFNFLFGGGRRSVSSSELPMQGGAGGQQQQQQQGRTTSSGLRSEIGGLHGAAAAAVAAVGGERRGSAAIAPSDEEDEEERAGETTPLRGRSWADGPAEEDEGVGVARADGRVPQADDEGDHLDDDHEDRSRHPDEAEEHLKPSEDAEEPSEVPPWATGPPTTLLAELQLRKQQQRQRTRTAANAFPHGMHSTLLELDAVAQVEARRRRGQRVALAWEDPDALAAAEQARRDDDDVPLGVLFKGRGGAGGAAGDGGAAGGDLDWDRPLGLIEKRELEDNEPLSRRRNRLRGGGADIARDPSPPKKAVAGAGAVQQHLHMQNGGTPSPHLPSPQPGESPPGATTPAAPGVDANADAEGDPDETLAQRTRRLKSREKLNSAIGRPVSTDFAAEMMSSLGSPGGAEGETTGADKPEHHDAEDEGETLGQRRARLQAQNQLTGGSSGGGGGVAGAPRPGTGPRQASGGSAGGVNGGHGAPGLKSMRSLADLLAAHPMGEAGAAGGAGGAGGGGAGGGGEGRPVPGGLLHASERVKARERQTLKEGNGAGRRASGQALVDVGGANGAGAGVAAAGAAGARGLLGANETAKREGATFRAGMYNDGTGGVGAGAAAGAVNGGLQQGYGATAGMGPGAVPGFMAFQQQQQQQQQQQMQMPSLNMGYQMPMSMSMPMQTQMQMQMSGVGMPLGMGWAAGGAAPGMHGGGGGTPGGMFMGGGGTGGMGMGMGMGMGGMGAMGAMGPAFDPGAAHAAQQPPMDQRQRDMIDRWRQSIMQ